jgi:hypothetical protein
MSVTETRPYLGLRCTVVVSCRACGGTHTRTGTLQPGAAFGDVVIEGLVYSLEEVRSIAPTLQTRPAESQLQRALPYLLLLGALFTWVQRGHH